MGFQNTRLTPCQLMNREQVIVVMLYVIDKTAALLVVSLSTAALL